LPKDEYTAELIDNGLYELPDGRQLALLIYRIVSGKYKGREFAHRLWLANTDRAESYCRMVLRTLGLDNVAQLQTPLYPEKQICCKVRLGTYEPEDGPTYNTVVRFTRLRVEEVDPGSPKPNGVMRHQATETGDWADWAL
jgi:hypothetical protein